MENTILVTGGAGFIGSAVVRHLMRTHAGRVVCLDALTYAGNMDNLRSVADDDRFLFVHGDIRDGDLVSQILATHRPRAILHLAAESHVDRSIDGPAAFLDTNVMGTFTLLEASRNYLKTLPEEGRTHFRFVHVSTDEVYGSLGADGFFTESSPYDPSSPYSASKAASDHLVRAWGRTFGVPVLITNCSNNYGPFQFPEKLIPHLTLSATAGKPLPVYGDGSNVRDWLHVDDHVRALLAVLDDGRVGETYLIGGRAERTNLAIAHGISDALDELQPRADGQSYRTQIEFVTDRPGHDHRYAIDPSKLERETGWHPQVGFEEGLRQTVAWYLDHPDWSARILSGAYRGERLGVLS